MEKYYPYDCEQCGNCCRHIDLVKALQEFNRGDGVCKNLAENNLCKIYSERPPVCNGKFVYENFYSDMTVEEFHKMAKKLCSQLQGLGVRG